MKRFSDSLRSSELLSASELMNEGQEPAAYGPDYVSHLRAIFPKAAKRGVVLYARISDPRPGTRETTTDQLEACNDDLTTLEEEFGRTVKVHGTFQESVSGWQWDERTEFKKAVKLAKKHGAVLVAFDVSRFVRNEQYQFTKQEPTEADFAQLMKLVGNVQLATIADPIKHEDRSRSSRRGKKNAKAAKAAKCYFGVRISKLPKAVRMQMRQLKADGLTLRDIGTKVGVSKSQAHRYISMLPPAWIEKLRK